MNPDPAPAACSPSIRYGQCWEDADVLMEGLDVQRGDSCLSIGSAGDNTLALLSKAPERVIVVDYNPVQLACLQLRIAAWQALTYSQTMELLGVIPSRRRASLYRSCRLALSVTARRYWDQQPGLIVEGAIHTGRLDRYLTRFRKHILPWIHPAARVDRLFHLPDGAERKAFFQREWNTAGWRTLFRLFFSRWFMERAGRDRACFAQVSGGIAGHLLQRAEHALVELDPAENPYLRWILTGSHGALLPYAWREEHYDGIRAHLDRLSLHCASLDQVLGQLDAGSIDRFNLSDVGEYLSPEQFGRLMGRITKAARPGARMAYWNLFVARQRPDELAGCIRSLATLAGQLHRKDKTFFYQRFVLEEVTCR